MTYYIIQYRLLEDLLAYRPQDLFEIRGYFKLAYTTPNENHTANDIRFN